MYGGGYPNNSNFVSPPSPLMAMDLVMFGNQNSSPIPQQYPPTMQQQYPKPFPNLEKPQQMSPPGQNNLCRKMICLQVILLILVLLIIAGLVAYFIFKEKDLLFFNGNKGKIDEKESKQN
uniref:Uncharacterized protein n=1 Tax=Meloidogyne hapla TaxID=6305 RepID=A0A1I8BDW0_MELHA